MKAFLIALLGIVVVLGAIAFQGFLIMLILAGLHAFVSSSIPAVGFVGSCLIGVALALIGSFFRR